VRPLLLLAACLCLSGSAAPGPVDRTILVWHEELHNGEWWVPFAVGSQHGVARCGTAEEARALYAVLAAVMVGGER